MWDAVATTTNGSAISTSWRLELCRLILENSNALRPYRGLGIIGLAENSGRAQYDALQISANRRMSAGLQFGVGYTWSRNMDNGSSKQSFSRTQTILRATGESRTWIARMC